MENIRISWGWLNADDLSQGWFIKIYDADDEDLWAEKAVDVAGYDYINVIGTDVEMMVSLIDCMDEIEDACREEKDAYEAGIASIQNLTPADFI